jgi:hypothetical protein
MTNSLKLSENARFLVRGSGRKSENWDTLKSVRT